MLNNNELQQVRQVILDEIAQLDIQKSRPPGSFAYLCGLGGQIIHSHQPVGVVLHTFNGKGTGSCSPMIQPESA